MSFIDLPYDVHLAILNYSRPWDILAIRQTCRILSQVSNDRSLWIHAVERLCIENALFLPSFDKENMSTRDLEHACLGPERWERLLAKDASSTHALPEKRSLSFRIEGSSYFKKIYLVPGGRYMLALVEDNGSFESATRLTLWDLKTVDPEAAKPIESIKVDLYCPSFTIHQSVDGKRLRVLTRKRIFSMQKYSVFEISPGEPFKLLGTLWVGDRHRMEFTSVFRDLLIVVHGPVVKVWNFVENRGISWAVMRPMRSSQMMVENGAVILLTPETAYVFKIPPLRFTAEELEARESENPVLEPTAVVKYVTPSPNLPEVEPCNAICDWYTGNPQPILFDFPGPDDQNQYVRFQLIFPFPDSLEGVRVDRLCSYVVPNRQEDNAHSPYRLCGENVVLWWTTTDQIRCTVGRKDASHPDLIASNVLLTENAPFLDYKEFSLCPTSGRLIWIDSSTTKGCIVKDFEPLPGKGETLASAPEAGSQPMDSDGDMEETVSPVVI